MTLGDHLEELRLRIFAILGVWIITSSIIGIFSTNIHKFLVQPFKEITSEPLILGTVYGPLEVYFKLSIILGILVSLPISLSILWGYITPALSRRAAILGHIVVFISSLLFWGGVIFAWIYLFPLSLKMMLNYFLPDQTIAQTTIEKYYSFLFLILIGTGVTFQLPLLVILLGSLGIVTMEWHKKAWKFIVVLLFLFSAIITPPDPLSMIVLAVPLMLLYFISVGIVWLIELRRKKEYEIYEAT
ncbi:MAG: sec-independent protein translocase protein TatC [Leptospiraceae bacterium]|nr:MAG: sec-independent protein translocase protein TatC [Leptospiraceae bacterium]